MPVGAGDVSNTSFITLLSAYLDDCCEAQTLGRSAITFGVDDRHVLLPRRRAYRL